jgi:ElaA protein
MSPTSCIGPRGIELHWRCMTYAQLPTALWNEAVSLRHAVFVVGQSCNYRNLDGLDPICTHVTATTAVHSGLLACARIVPPGQVFTEPAIGRVVVNSYLRNKGLRPTLKGHAVEATRARYPGQPLRISSQAHLRGYYRDFGFRATGLVYDDEGIAHVDMLREARR